MWVRDIGTFEVRRPSAPSALDALVRAAPRPPTKRPAGDERIVVVDRRSLAA